ncbi:hypothetical protein MMC24_002744 [Lignoscripta atroalba]|nr:hypothetical protein [Lignoscripta atroalba]
MPHAVAYETTRLQSRCYRLATSPTIQRNPLISCLSADHRSQKTAPSTPNRLVIPATKEETTQPTGSGTRVSVNESNGTSPIDSNGETTTSSRLHLHRPHLHSRPSTEKVGLLAPASPKNNKDLRSIPPSSPGRRNSWISNISSKFSSNTNTPSNTSVPSSPQVSKPPASPQVDQPNQFGTVVAPGLKETKRPDPLTQPSQSPKSGHPSFLTSAFRRLSSSSGGVSLGKMAGSGATCQRKVMNVDPYRDRCKIDDLEPAKLRRVAFCVDVEIAGTARYADEEDQETPPPQSGRRPSLTQLEQQIEVKKKKDKKMKERGEGEALKNAEALAREKDKEGVVDVTGENVSSGMTNTDALPEGPLNGEVKDPSRKKEKKKRSEEERKERKERKKQEAVANGTVPVELSRDSSSATESPSGALTPPKPQDRPTTDPLRIYRRCCQLRETPVLKKITEQLSSSSACDPLSPGTVVCLDLTGFWMQLSDITTFSDYLAVVPVKKLIMEDCGLTDEAVRVILAGLLAAKTPDQAKHNKHLAKKAAMQSAGKAEQLGVIEKLSLKNNPKIGRDGWRHIGLFIHMSKSLKAIDVSMNPFPQAPASSSSAGSLLRSQSNAKVAHDISTILTRAVAERLAGSQLEELVMAECGLTSANIEKVVDAVMECGLTRLGLANNDITLEGLQHVVRYVRTGKCEGLDLGGNDLCDNLHILADALDDRNILYALSLADCNLSPSAIKSLFPALVRLPNFRFIDLSHNRNLFATQPNALNLLRKYLPQLPLLKRIHLADVAMSPDHAIALAEVLPEIPSLAHLNILENPHLTSLASAKDEATQEEACAFYASLMAAVRVSDSIVCIDIDVPSQDSSEVVKALAKQVVAYCLRNMERGPVAEAYESAAASIADPHGGERPVAVPEVLLHLLGHVDGCPENHDQDAPAPDDDYIVGGTGVVKALGVCLGNRVADYRRPSRDTTPANSGTVTPQQVLQGTSVSKGKAKDMSKNLLGSARKIRARLQPALVQEARNGNEMGHRSPNIFPLWKSDTNLPTGRLQFLDSTLERMIQRFEDEYPETRLESLPTRREDASEVGSLPSLAGTSSLDADTSGMSEAIREDTTLSDDEDRAVRMPVSRHNSDVSLASRHLGQEEGRMHRFGQQIRRDILRPMEFDYAHGTTGREGEPQHLRKLRETLELWKGEDIKEAVEDRGSEAVLRELGATAEELLVLKKEDPEGFEMFREAQLIAQHNLGKPASERRQEEIV